MNTNEIIRRLVSLSLIGGLGGLVSLGMVATAWGECVQNPPGASTVLSVAAAQSCDNIAGQTGCTVEFNGSKFGNCLVRDASGNGLFYVVAEYSNNNGLSWQIAVDPSVPLSAQVNTVLVESEEVDACNYIYANEATAGTGLGYFETNGSSGSGNFANVETISFCTDGESNDLPPPRCEDLSELDGVGIDCSTVPAGEPRILFSATPDSPTWNTLGCTCNVPLGLQSCDEAAEDGEVNKCTGDNPLQALPVTIELGNDGTWICRTIGGERQCWKR